VLTDKDEDPEGDVRMQSSSEGSEDDLNDMFPEANQPSNTATLTPQNSNMYQNMQQFSELSPPTSQDPIDPRNFGNDPIDSTTKEGESSRANISDILQTRDVGSAPKKDLSVAEREPGASWNNGKHRAEEERVGEQLLDKNFSLREHPPVTLNEVPLIMYR
ncbi:MAG: hypothetical protein Q9192_006772, partial [Flavoplaca navasiana]